MSAFEVLVFTTEPGEQAIADAMAPYKEDGTYSNPHGKWIWYAIGGYGGKKWDGSAYAYIDTDGTWHSQHRDEISPEDGEMGTLIPLPDWRHEMRNWINQLPDDGHVTLVRCKG